MPELMRPLRMHLATAWRSPEPLRADPAGNRSPRPERPAAAARGKLGQPRPRAGEPIRVDLRLAPELWNQLLADALAGECGLTVVRGSDPGWCAPDREQMAAAWRNQLQNERQPTPRAGARSPHPEAPVEAGAGGEPHLTVLVTAMPAERAGWAQLAQWCRRERVRVLVLGENRPACAARALRLGASGYLDWRSPLPVLVKAIRGVHAGELWAERKVAMALLRPRADERAGHPLTPRELRVLEALAEGKRNKEIAAQLAISETTVKSHLNRAFHKLHVSDRLQAALYIERHGLE